VSVLLRGWLHNHGTFCAALLLLLVVPDNLQQGKHRVE
jgi:hypothetical protein